jgi:acyl-CoA thioesterase FadM
MNIRVYYEDADTHHRLIVEGSATLVTIDAQGKVKRLNSSFLEALSISDLKSQMGRTESRLLLT